jgi:hypothetical protein
VKTKLFTFSRWPALIILVCIFLLTFTNLALAFSSPIVTENWRSGYMASSPQDYLNFSGRALSPSFSITTSAPLDRYVVFPAPGLQKQVVAARVNLLNRTGSAGTATLALEVFSMSGVLQRTITTEPFDLIAVPTGSWAAVDLLTYSANLNLMPGEYLAFHIHIDTVTPMTIQPVFDVALSQDTYFVAFPSIRR